MDIDHKTADRGESFHEQNFPQWSMLSSIDNVFGGERRTGTIYLYLRLSTIIEVQDKMASGGKGRVEAVCYLELTLI